MPNNITEINVGKEVSENIFYSKNGFWFFVPKRVALDMFWDMIVKEEKEDEQES